MRPRSPRQPRGISRVVFSASSSRPLRWSAPQLGQICEVRGRPGAVEQVQPSGQAGLYRLRNHRPKRRDAGATGHEQELGFGGSGRQDERAERPIHGHARTTPQPAQVRSPSLRLELQQELQMAVCGRLTGSRGNRVGHALRLSAEAEQGCLSGLVAERTAAERQPDNARGRRRAPDAGDLKIAGGQNVEMLLLDRSRSAGRRVGGSASRRVRRPAVDRWSEGRPSASPR